MWVVDLLNNHRGMTLYIPRLEKHNGLGPVACSKQVATIQFGSPRLETHLVGHCGPRGLSRFLGGGQSGAKRGVVLSIRREMN